LALVVLVVQIVVVVVAAEVQAHLQLAMEALADLVLLSYLFQQQDIQLQQPVLLLQVVLTQS
jgi:hypothetical protein